MMNEVDKLRAGLPYDFTDPEVDALKLGALKWCQEPHALAEPVRIGDDVWMGGNVTVLPGVTVGNNVER